jgi:hypothetical protein
VRAHLDALQTPTYRDFVRIYSITELLLLRRRDLLQKSGWVLPLRPSSHRARLSPCHRKADEPDEEVVALEQLKERLDLTNLPREKLSLMSGFRAAFRMFVCTGGFFILMPLFFLFSVLRLVHPLLRSVGVPNHYLPLDSIQVRQ